MEASELELRARINALEAALAELRAEAEGAFDLGCEYPGEGTAYAIEVPPQQVFGGIGNGVAKEEILPLTIRRFEVDGGVKWGLYVPDQATCSMIDFRKFESDGVETGSWETLVLELGAYQTVDAEHPLWRDVTHVIEEAADGEKIYADVSRLEDGLCELALMRSNSWGVTQPWVSSSGGGEVSGDGWACLLGSVWDDEEGVRHFSQSYYGPIVEERMKAGFRLMGKASSSSWTGWQVIADGAELNPEQEYRLLPQIEGRVWLYSASKQKAVVSANARHRNDWYELGGVVVKPFVWANFSGTVS